MSTILERAMAMNDEIVANRRTIHQNPEVGHNLPNTVKLVKEKLTAMGYEPKDVCEGGVSVTVGGKRGGKTILLRADMDALPMEETSGLPFCSTNGYGHTCGHDMHAAMLLGAAKLLKEDEDELEGTVKLMFQPAEEMLSGANAMIQGGILENPKVDAAMALHVFPGDLHPGVLATNVGPIAASADMIIIKIKGHGGHGSEPEKAIDPINVGVHIHLAMQELIAREVGAQETVVLTFGAFNAGNASNIIPETAEMQGTLRAFNNELREHLKKRIVEVATGVANTFRATAEVEYRVGTPANINDAEMTKEVSGYVTEAGMKVVEAPRMMGSEDFAYVSSQIPSVFFSLGAGGDDECYHRGNNHSPLVVFNEDCLHYGVATLVTGAENWLKNHK